MVDSKVDKAILFASKKHEGMMRKGSLQPYIFHPLDVLNICSMLTNDDDILCAAVLHDTIEDTDTSYEELVENFGKNVADIVADESENKRGNVNKEATWHIRKQESIDMLNKAPIGAKMVCLSDKVSNLRSFHLLKLQEGDKFLDHFNMKDPKEHYWYYSSIRDNIQELKDTAVYKEYVFLIETVFGGK